MFNFEKLDVWQKAIGFADLVYNHTRHFPADERFGLTNQMRRAAVSISSNIAEGTSRVSQADFARFIEIAMGSVFEVVSQAFVGRRQDFLNQEASAHCTQQLRKLGACSAAYENHWLPHNAMRMLARLSTINSQL
jgi:four helix bundle protein